MSTNAKAILNLIVNAVAGVGGVLIAAAQPANRWQWVQLVSGIAVALAGVLRATWNETPGVK